MSDWFNIAEGQVTVDGATAEIHRRPTLEQFARETFNLPADWHVYKWDFHNQNFSVVTGAVCTEYFTKGKRKGRLNWGKMDKSTNIPVTISDAQFRAWQAQWEVETGKCCPCEGSGQAWAGWSVDEGTRTKTCTRCLGSGVAP